MVSFVSSLILPATAISILLLCMYTSWISLQKYMSHNQENQIVSYAEQRLNLSSLWGEQQFEDYYNQYEDVGFDVREHTIHVKGTLKQDVKFEKLEIGTDDAKHIQQIKVLNKNKGILLIKGSHFVFVYSVNFHYKCYQKIGIQKSTEYLYIDHESKLWVFTHPNNNIIIMRIYNCKNGQLLHTSKSATPSKIQLISQIIQQKTIIKVKCLTFSRNYLHYEFDQSTFSLISTNQVPTHSIDYYMKHAKIVETKISQRIKNSEAYITLQQFLHTISFGFAGRLTTTKVQEKQNELQYEIQAMDCDRDIVLRVGKGREQTSLISFGDVLVPLRTPVFLSKQDEQKLIPFDLALNKTQEGALPLIDFKMYGIKSKNLEIIKGRSGLYRILPDAKVHFMSFDNKFLSFYPRQNLNQEDFYAIRIPQGGIVMKGSNIQGIFDDLPTNTKDPKDLRYGYDPSEVYIEQTTNAVEVMPSLYESHIVHKGLFTRQRRNKIDLISITNGKPILSHQIATKNGYQYSTAFIENNQFWVFQHKTGEHAIITKYEMFVNASSPKNLLYIKRTYDFGIEGRVTRVQKCVDFFYYFTYVTDSGRFGIARIHHALASNRQARADQKYSGAFQKMMVIQNIQRNTKINISPAEEQLLKVQLQMDDLKIVKAWKQLQFKHQYRVLPVRMYEWRGTYYIFNIRKIMLDAFDWEIKETRKHVFLNFLTYSTSIGLFIILVLIIIGVKYGKNRKDQNSFNQPVSAQPSGGPKAEQTSAETSKIIKNQQSPKKQEKKQKKDKETKNKETKKKK